MQVATVNRQTVETVAPAAASEPPRESTRGATIARAPATWPWPARLAGALGAGAALVVTLGAAGQWLRHGLGVKHSFGFIFQFAPNEEGNLATWYASSLLLCCAGLLGAIAWRSAGSRYRRHWAGLALLLLAMSADETAQAHEMLIHPLRALWGTGGVFHYAWVIPGMAIVLIVLVACAGFLRNLPPRTRRFLILAAAVYFAGALGTEMAGGYYASRWSSKAPAYALLTCVEEALELAGAVLLAYALADHLSRVETPGNHHA